jgi:hypothetical protein
MTVALLAQLRAGSLDGVDRDMAARLTERMSRTVKAGFVVLGERVEHKPTGWWRVMISRVDYHGFVIRPEVLEPIMVQRLSGPSSEDLEGEPQIEVIVHQDAVTVEAAREFHRLDPEGWSDQACAWAGVKEALAGAAQVVTPRAGDVQVMAAGLHKLLCETGTDEGRFYDPDAVQRKLDKAKENGLWGSHVEGRHGYYWKLEAVEWFRIKSGLVHRSERWGSGSAPRPRVALVKS